LDAVKSEAFAVVLSLAPAGGTQAPSVGAWRGLNTPHAASYSLRDARGRVDLETSTHKHSYKAGLTVCGQKTLQLFWH
jgi:hypothetical protein